ncbi:hypothetical protein CFB3_41650 [Clostridium folliculivorans]|uniref:Uncharacterized protein n=1 Tax=Clostridium folliculivorans TaxID=2886038 RepID=A0A9W6DC51_9CLOT|nr:hypothetical protein CFOLD11_32150 [Clostridium folliculivorans]GKU32057.1 hypothetical protein CFB3_41650 [Clostridium folliculivorans]
MTRLVVLFAKTAANRNFTIKIHFYEQLFTKYVKITIIKLRVLRRDIMIDPIGEWD